MRSAECQRAEDFHQLPDLGQSQLLQQVQPALRAAGPVSAAGPLLQSQLLPAGPALRAVSEGSRTSISCRTSGRVSCSSRSSQLCQGSISCRTSGQLLQQVQPALRAAGYQLPDLRQSQLLQQVQPALRAAGPVSAAGPRAESAAPAGPASSEGSRTSISCRTSGRVSCSSRSSQL